MATTPTKTSEQTGMSARLNWLAAIIIGAAAVIFGIYLLVAPADATALIVAIISIVLLLASLIHMLIGFRRDVNELAARMALFTGGVGISVGAIVALDVFYDYLDSGAARAILAGGLIVYGVLGLVGLVFSREQGLVLRTIVACLVALAFAALLLLNVRDQRLHAAWFGIALVVAGLILIGLGYLIQSRRQSQTGSDGGGRFRMPGRPARGDRGDSHAAMSRLDDTTPDRAREHDETAARTGSVDRDQPRNTGPHPAVDHRPNRPVLAGDDAPSTSPSPAGADADVIDVNPPFRSSSGSSSPTTGERDAQSARTIADAGNGTDASRADRK